MANSQEGIQKDTKKGFHRAWLVLIGCCFLQACGLGLVLNSAGVFFVPVCNDLGFSQGDISKYLTFYSWATCVGMLLVARLFPRIDVRISMSICTAAVAIALGLMSVYTEVWQWYASGIVFGLAGSFLFVVPTPILIGNWFDKHEGVAVGMAMAFSGIGAAIFSPLLTWFIAEMGWRTTYLIAAIIMAVAILPWTLFVFRFSPQRIGLEPYGHTGKVDPAEEAEHIPGIPWKKALPTLSFIALFLFAGLCSFYGAYNSQLPNFAVNIGETAMFGATLISVSMVGNVVSKILSGYLIDAIGATSATIIQAIIVGVSMLIFALLHEPFMLYIAAFAFGFQNSLVSVSVPLLIKSSFGSKSYTEIFAFVRLGTGILGGIGVIVVSASYDAFGDYTFAFFMGFAVAVGCIVCVLLDKLGNKSLQPKWEE